jgi:GT2 family glycosyltransferase
MEGFKNNSSDLTVVVPTKDRPMALSSLLGSLCNQTLNKFNISIALNTDDSWDTHLDKLILALEIKGIRVEVSKCLGFSLSELHQYLVKSSDTEYICRLDDDHVPQANYLETLLNAFHLNKNIGAVGGVVLHPEINDLNFTNKEFQEHLQVARNKLFLNTLLQLKKHPTDTPLLVPDLYSTFLTRKSIIDEVGGIATCYEKSGYREETDLTLRITDAGYKEYIIPKAITYHIRAENGGERQSSEDWIKSKEENEIIFNQRIKDMCKNIHSKALKIWECNLNI